MNSTMRSLVFWIAMAVIAAMVWNFSTKFQTAAKALTFTEFMMAVDTGQIAQVTMTGNEISGTTKANDTFRTVAPPQYEGLANRLLERNVVVTAREPTASPWTALLSTWVSLARCWMTCRTTEQPPGIAARAPSHSASSGSRARTPCRWRVT